MLNNRELFDKDGTYNLETLESVSYDYGYQVSFERPNQSQEVIAQALELFQSLGTLHLGVWEGDKEFSIWVETLTLAVELATTYDQDAIWDWENMKPIHLKG